MQSEAIKYQPPVEGVVVTQEEEDQILKLGRIAGEQLRQSHKDVRQDVYGDGIPVGDGISGAVVGGLWNCNTVRGGEKRMVRGAKTIAEFKIRKHLEKLEDLKVL